MISRRSCPGEVRRCARTASIYLAPVSRVIIKKKKYKKKQKKQQKKKKTTTGSNGGCGEGGRWWGRTASTPRQTSTHSSPPFLGTLAPHESRKRMANLYQAYRLIDDFVAWKTW